MGIVGVLPKTIPGSEPESGRFAFVEEFADIRSVMLHSGREKQTDSSSLTHVRYRPHIRYRCHTVNLPGTSSSYLSTCSSTDSFHTPDTPD